MIPGIDVSHWQRDIDWGEVKRSGVKFAFIKATEFPDKKTTLFVDEKMQKNIDGASSNGIFWSAYHFFRTHIDPIIQANVFCETVGEFSSLPPVLDLEVAGSKGERLNYKVRQFLDETERISNRKPIIYSSGGFWRSYMTCEKRVHADWAREYPLWIAQYTNLWPNPLYPWAGWDFWQFSDKGKIPGIDSHVDMNWFNGSIEDLQEKFIELNITKLREKTNPILFENFDENKKDYDQLNSLYRGDFQEPSNQMRIKNKTNDFCEIKTSPKHVSSSSFKEEDWIRTYFLQKTTLNNLNSSNPNIFKK
jgi:lysozyme